MIVVLAISTDCGRDADKVYSSCHATPALISEWTMILAYYHPVVEAIQMMQADAIIKADPRLKIVDKVKDPEKYCQLHDGILHEVLGCNSDVI